MKLILVALLALAGTAGPTARTAHNLVVGEDGSVAKYYGVPTTLKISDVPSLRLPYKMGSEESEGQKLRTAIISARNHVRVVVVFDQHGDAIDVRTRSRRAVDPKGIRVGDTLSRVQKLWPKGKLYFGNSIEGGYPYAVFLTGTNVSFDLTTRDIRHDRSKAFVTTIHIQDLGT